MDFAKDELLKLDNQLCFAVYALSKEITKLYRPYLDKLGLTYTQYITLLALWEKDEVSLKDLGEKLYLDSGTLTPLLKKLEAMDLISRVRDKRDERNLVIVLTNKGRELKVNASDIPLKMCCNLNIEPKEALKLREEIKKTLKGIRCTTEEKH